MNNRLITVFVMVLGLICSIFVILQIIFNPTGGLAGLLKYVAVPLVLISFLTPKTGLVLLCWVNFYADYYKKLAVYYGTSSMMTVMEVLALSMAMVGAILLGTTAQSLLRGPVPDRTSIIISIVSAVMTAMLFFSDSSGGMSGRVQYAINGGLYLGLSAVMCYLLPDKEAAMRLCRLQFWLGVPWVLWAMRQYIWGFTEMEWFYARKGFSPVLSGQMLGAGEEARPYGFAGSSSAFGVITYLFMFGVWHAIRYEKMRALFWLGSIIYFIGLVVSTQRTILILPFITFGAYLLFRTPAGTKFFYGATAVALLSGILASDFLLARLGDANDSMRIEGSGWASKVVQVGTFADRLKGWTRLKKAKSYSLFGKGNAIVAFDSDDYSHDVINRILIDFGVVGLTISMGFLIWMAKTVHTFTFRIRNPEDRDVIVFVVAVVGVNGIGTLMSGNNTHTVPINLVLATLVGLAAVVYRRGQEAEAEEAALEPAVAPLPKGLPLAGVSREERARIRMRPNRR